MMSEDVRTRATQLACMVKRMDVTDERWLRALQEGVDNLVTALESEEVLVEVKGRIFRDEDVEGENVSDLAIEAWLDLEPQEVRVRILAVKEGER